MQPEPGRLPSLHVIGDSIPQAYYRALKAVRNDGALMPTEYDRRDAGGNLLDPPGRDARVLIEVKDPFAQPRFPPICHCELGVYIAEIMGVKDNRVVPKHILKKMIAKEVLTAEEDAYKNFWPYTYHQRLFNHPEMDSNNTVDQVTLAIERVVNTPYTRRAMCTTSVPNLDPFLKEDNPCLREIQLRCPEDENGNLVLNVSTTWRSRDLFKAWGDNVIGLTFLFARIAEEISEGAGRPVKLGSYADYSMSLHIYGQDCSHFSEGSAEYAGFFETFPSEDYFVAKSLNSQTAAFMFVLDQLKKLKTPEQIRQWGFTEETLMAIGILIERIESGEYIC